MFYKGIVIALGFSLCASMGMAQCLGSNLFDAMPQEKQDDIRARAQAAPFAFGNFWRASKGDQSLIIIGTYHVDDERHYDTIEKIAPYWETAKGLLVEATPAEQAALRRDMAERPQMLYLTQGPSLIQLLKPQVWAQLSTAFEARGIPSFVAAKFQPWFAALTLGLSACQTLSGDEGGLDKLLIDTAQLRGLPLSALEPHDTLFKIFDSVSQEEEIEILESALKVEHLSDDNATTLADLYFRQESRLLWELARELSYDYSDLPKEKIDADTARAEEILMNARNRAWIPVINKAASKGPQIVAFGALHLSGNEGVLNLLKLDGWQLEALF